MNCIQYNQQIAIGVENILVLYVRNIGPITSLDRWAHDNEISPIHVRRCARRAAAKGLVQLTRLEDQSGRPYRVTLKEETK